MKLLAGRVIETMDPVLHLAAVLFEARRGRETVELISIENGWSPLLTDLSRDLARLPFERQKAFATSDRFRPRQKFRRCEARTRRGWPCPLPAWPAGRCAVHEKIECGR